MHDVFSRVLVTGASGLVGNNIVRSLLELGVETRVLLRNSSNKCSIEGLDVEVAIGDILDCSAVEEAVDGVSCIFHCAALVRIGGRDLGLFRSVNTEGTRLVAEAALRENARLVYVSTSDTIACDPSGLESNESAPFDQRHATCYSLSKYGGELAISEAVKRGLDGVIVNPSFMLGPWDWKPSSGAMLNAVAKGLGRIAPKGFGCFADVRDVTSSIIEAAAKGASGERYLLSGETLSYLEAWKIFSEISGGRPPIRELRPIGSLIVGKSSDMIGAIFGREPVANSTALRAASCPRRYSTRKAEMELGYRRRPLHETVRDAWRWLVESDAQSLAD